MEFEFLLDGIVRKISFEKKDLSFVFSEGEINSVVDIQRVSSHQISVLIDGVSYLIYITKNKDCRHIMIDGQAFVVKEPTEEADSFHKGEERTAEGILLVKAPMPGKVIKVCVSPNDKVRKNQTLAIVEAMKMENEIKASVDGKVKAIHIAAGDLVDPEMPLIELEP